MGGDGRDGSAACVRRGIRCAGDRRARRRPSRPRWCRTASQRGEDLLWRSNPRSESGAAGAVPATVGGRRRGRPGRGWTLRRLSGSLRSAMRPARSAPGTSRACVVQRALGSTTVGGTLAACRITGIRFMATGGIGGVHRGFADSLDISADLMQIASTPAVVVCSGAKSDTRRAGHRRAARDPRGSRSRLADADPSALLHRGRRAPGPPPSWAPPAEAAEVAAVHWAVNPSGGARARKAARPTGWI